MAFPFVMVGSEVIARPPAFAFVAGAAGVGVRVLPLDSVGLAGVAFVAMIGVLG